MATLMERDIALVTKDSSGNNVIEYPVTRAAQVEDLATVITDAIKAQAPSPANMKGATASAAGTAGLVPAPAAGAQAKYLRGDGTWQTPPTPANMKGATASAAGTAGLVPAPAAGAQAKYLRGDGTWQTPPTPANNVSLSSNITVTQSTQAARTASGNSTGGYDTTSGSGSYSSYRYNTVVGIAAGTYTLQTLLQNLVTKSHTHTVTRILSNCDCSGDSDCDSDSDNYVSFVSY